MVKANNLGMRVSQAEETEERDHATMNTIQGNLDRTKQAATLLGGQLQAATAAGDQTKVASLTASVTQLISQIEHIGGEEGDGSKSGTLFDAIQAHAQSESDLHELQQVHAAYVASLTTAKTNLEQAKSDMAHAQQQEARAHELQHQAEIDQGLKSGLSTTNVALDAMRATAAAARVRSRAAKLTTAAMKEASGGNTDDLVAATLASASAPATPMSALDKLAKLTGKAA